MTRPSLTLILPLCLALAVACKGDSVGPERVLTTLEVSATSAALFPEYTSQLTISAWDQFGVPMLERFDGEWAHKATYFSSAPEIAEVSSSGLVRGVAAGTAEITATLTLGSFTRTAVMTTTVLRLDSNEVVLTSDSRGWEPSEIHIKAGGIVHWQSGTLNWSGVSNTKLWLMDAAYSVVDTVDLSSGFATRKFENPGTIRYCSGGCWDPPDFGSIYVH